MFVRKVQNGAVSDYADCRCTSTLAFFIGLVFVTDAYAFGSCVFFDSMCVSISKLCR